MDGHDYQPRTPERLVEILRAQSQNPRSWPNEAADAIEQFLRPVPAMDRLRAAAHDLAHEINTAPSTELSDEATRRAQ